MKLRKPTEFTAVANGKKVGMVQLPAGTETHLVKVNGQQLGLEYQGGGAWVPLAETDLLDHVKISNQ